MGTTWGPQGCGGWVVGWMGGLICESMGGVRSYN